MWGWQVVEPFLVSLCALNAHVHTNHRNHLNVGFPEHVSNVPVYLERTRALSALTHVLWTVVER